MYRIYAIAWIPMVFIAIANGIFRESVIAKYVSSLTAHQLSCLTGVTLFFIYTMIIARYWPLENNILALRIGLMWLLMTIAFEFVFGHYVAGHPWSFLFADYNVLAGRLWSLVLIFVALLPLLARIFVLRTR